MWQGKEDDFLNLKITPKVRADLELGLFWHINQSIEVLILYRQYPRRNQAQWRDSQISGSTAKSKKQFRNIITQLETKRYYASVIQNPIFMDLASDCNL